MKKKPAASETRKRARNRQPNRALTEVYQVAGAGSADLRRDQASNPSGTTMSKIAQAGRDSLPMNASAAALPCAQVTAQIPAIAAFVPMRDGCGVW